MRRSGGQTPAPGTDVYLISASGKSEPLSRQVIRSAKGKQSIRWQTTFKLRQYRVKKTKHFELSCSAVRFSERF